MEYNKKQLKALAYGFLVEFCADNPENYSSKQWNKKVNELIKDTDEWLDKEVIEELTDPYLMHYNEF